MRLAVAATLAASLCLAGCGRKGGLDAPPSALPAAPQSQAGVQQPSGFGDPGPIFASPQTLGADSSASSPPPQAQQQAAQTQPAPKKTFFLDWLIN
jgi:predicted small lipoprotein YifL